MTDRNDMLASLLEALEEAPGSQKLAMAAIRALAGDGDFAKAVALARQHLKPEALKDEDRRFAAELALEQHAPDLALSLSAGAEAPQLKIVAARALLALGREAEGRPLYAQAVAANASLEDPALLARLNARVVEPPARGADNVMPFGRRGEEIEDDGEEAPRDTRPRLRVISDDPVDPDDDVVSLIAPPQERIDFSDVGGLQEVKQQIERRIILPFRKPSLFQRFKRRSGGGILLYGPPGVGKTLLARATAGECDADFINVAISDVLDMYIGESERKLSALFAQARAKAPCVLFFDEIEGLGGRREYGREATAAKLVSLFLSEMDGFASDNVGVLILGATNVPWAVDPAFRRPGRFDRVQFVPPPDRVARAEILKLQLDGRPVAGSIDVDSIAKRTSGFSGADLMNLVETATDIAIAHTLQREEETGLTTQMLVEALSEVKPTTTEWLSTARNYAKYANEGGQYDDVLQFLDKHAKGGA